MKRGYFSLVAFLFLSSCYSEDLPRDVINYNESSGPIRVLQSFGPENIFFDLEINEIRINNGEEIYFPIGSNGGITNVSLPSDIALTTGFNYPVTANFYIKNAQNNYTIFATGTDLIRWDSADSNPTLDAMRYQYLDIDGNGIIDVNEITEELATNQFGFIFTQNSNKNGQNDGGWGPRIRVKHRTFIEQLLRDYGDASGLKIQVAEPNPDWQWENIGSQYDDRIWYAYQIKKENGISCDPEYSDENISSIESTLDGLGFMYFRKNEIEYLTPIGSGHVDDLGDYKIGEVFSPQGVSGLINTNDDLGDSLMMVFVPAGHGGWLQAWEAGQGDQPSNFNPSCLFNLTSPPIVSR